MTALATKGGASAPSNVVRLPSAAPRQVQQRRNRFTRAVAAELRAQWPGEYIHPGIRAKLPDAAALLCVERTPELLLVVAMFETMSEEQRAQVRAYFEPLKHCNVAARGASVLIQLRTIGDQVNLDAAMQLLRREG